MIDTMNDVMILRRGGGSANLFGALCVAYPVGVSCTLTGKNTRKTLKAKDTSGQTVFAVPEAGTWTVEISKTKNGALVTKTKDVEISTEERCKNVKMAFETVYFDGGNVCDYSGGWNEQLTVGETIKLEVSGGSSSSWDIGRYGTANGAINLAEIEKLTITVPTCADCQTAYFYLSSTAGGEFGMNANPSPSDKWELTKGENIINVADFDGTYYLAFCIVNAKQTTNNSVLEISRISGE